MRCGKHGGEGEEESISQRYLMESVWTGLSGLQIGGGNGAGVPSDSVKD